MVKVKKIYNCPKCEYKTKYKSHYLNHLSRLKPCQKKIIEIEKDNKTICEYCKKKFHKKSISRHLKVCNKFKENGSILICTSSSKDKLNNLKNEIGSDHYFYELNLLKTEQIAAKVKSIVLEHSDIDVLINNAGLTKDNLFLRMKADQWNDVINVNLNSNFYIIKEILPSMLKKRKGISKFELKTTMMLQEILC